MKMNNVNQRVAKDVRVANAVVPRVVSRTQQQQQRRSLKPVSVVTPEKSTKPASTAVTVPETSTKQVYYSLDASTKTTRPRLVVLGSGWGAMSFIKSLPQTISQKYDLLLVSPRNYFLYTPLLPAVATGTMEERSIVEPVRNLMIGKGEFYEAVCTDIDPVARELVCCFPKDSGMPEACFKVAYDMLVVSVGSVNNTFGIPGVAQYCNFFKSIEDANSLRRRVSECFERASLPATPEAVLARLHAPVRRGVVLGVVSDAHSCRCRWDVIGSLLEFITYPGLMGAPGHCLLVSPLIWPTGVEVAAELYDMIHDDLSKLYPRLIADVNIQIVELMDHVLSTYDRQISIYTANEFKRTGIKLVLNSRVSAVSEGQVKVVNKANQETMIPFGACVWATGVAMNPLIKTMQERLPGQGHFRSILTDDALRVKGSDGSIFAIGDASTIDQPKALDYAERLFEQADVNKDGVMTLMELQAMMTKASLEFSHLEEYSRFLDGKTGMNRWGNMVKDVLKKPVTNGGPFAEVSATTQISKEEFKEMLGKIDKGLRALPATAQVAKQQGEFLAGLLSSASTVDQSPSVVAADKVFKYSHKGSTAYIGSDKAVFDVPNLGPLTGYGAGIAWKSFETFSQISFRNQCLVGTDWLRTKIFGRDISRV
ncbi:MAG: hypothetical protein WDW38_008956 [Sanguina aurantia]